MSHLENMRVGEAGRGAGEEGPCKLVLHFSGTVHIVHLKTLCCLLMIIYINKLRASYARVPVHKRPRTGTGTVRLD
jgi:hypothetical protein